MRSITVAAAVKRFLADQVDQVKPSTFYVYRLYLTRFARMHGRKRMDAITPALVRSWGKKHHPVAAVQRLFAWCKTEAMLIEANQLERMRKLPRGKRLRTCDRRLVTRIKRRASRAFRRLLIGLEESVARPHELREAKWQDIRVAGLLPFAVADLVAGRAFIFRDTFKAQQLRRERHAVRVIPISKRFGRLLARIYGAGQCDASMVFANERGKPWTINAVRCQFRRLRSRLKINADYRGENIVAYTMRHTAATAAIVAGVDLATLAGVMGHSDIRTTTRYVHLSPDFLAKAMNVIHEAKSTFGRKNDVQASLMKRPDEAR